MEGKQAMDIENIADLIDYVYTGRKGPEDERTSDADDISLSPSEKEYRKLKRIMKIMVRFYVKGADMKKKQVDQVDEDLAKLKNDLQMIKEQIAVLEKFPPFHPKRGEYQENLEKELEHLENQQTEIIKQKEPFQKLYEWSLQIVKTVEWLEENIYRYCKDFLQLDVDMDEKIKARLSRKLSVDEYRNFRRGLDEITFNLQESQDFFDASLDGRLKLYQQIEKCMIEAQLKVVQKYTEAESGRKKTVEEDLLRDLEYLKGHMEEDPKVTKHRENMKQIHRDFFAVLKWQRERFKDLLLEGNSSGGMTVKDLLDADDEAIEKLREEFRLEEENRKKKEEEEAAAAANGEAAAAPAAAPVAMKCPISTMPKNQEGVTIKNLYDEKCPVSKS